MTSSTSSKTILALLLLLVKVQARDMSVIRKEKILTRVSRDTQEVHVHAGVSQANEKTHVQTGKESKQETKESIQAASEEGWIRPLILREADEPEPDATCNDMDVHGYLMKEQSFSPFGHVNCAFFNLNPHYCCSARTYHWIGYGTAAERCCVCGGGSDSQSAVEEQVSRSSNQEVSEKHADGKKKPKGITVSNDMVEEALERHAYNVIAK